jgi:hypothetical protein
MIAIKVANANDVKTIQKIANQTWPDVYAEILSAAQLDFMLKAFYSPEVLLDNMLQRPSFYFSF